MVIDVHLEVSKLSSQNVENRAYEFKSKVPLVSLCSLGGFPIKQYEEGFFWCRNSFDFIQARFDLLEALGLSASLTYMNKSDKSLEGLGRLCETNDHTWAYHWIMLGFLINSNLSVELAITRDSRFKCSWPIKPAGGVPFIAHGSLKEWVRFASHKEDKDFDPDTRLVMRKVQEILDLLLQDQKSTFSG